MAVIGSGAVSQQGTPFDAVAEDYLRARAEYPAEMFDRLFDTASLKPGSLVLDIGCGSGQSTLEFARRGTTVVAIDPAKSALALLAGRCAELSGIELLHSRFEDFTDTRRFDLIACGQAFHWLDPTTAPGRFAELLKPRGYVALFWHLQDIAPESPQAILYAMSSKYFKSFPILNPPEYGREFVDVMAEVLSRSGLFADLCIMEYPWRQSYEPEMFKALFRSASNYAQLDQTAKDEITAELDDYVGDIGGEPIIEYRTCLIEARLGGA